MSSRERPRLKQARSITSLLREMLDKPGMGDQLTRHQAWLVWDKLVGPQIAARARPLRLRKGVLEIQVDHPVWMQQLQMMKSQILEKLTAQLPQAGITDIYLRKATKPLVLSAPPKEKSDSFQQWQKTELTKEEQQKIDRQLASVTDPELRREIHRLFILQLKLDKSRRNE